jgi:hypothetical protein
MVDTGTTPEAAPLLLAVARPFSDSQLIDHLLQKIKRHDLLIELARQHGVLPLLWTEIVKVNTALASECVLRIHDECFVTLAQNLAAVSELMTLLSVFISNGICALPFKGVVLADSVYGRVGLRPAGDLDLLIYRRDLPRATELLTDRGYELQTVVQADGSPVDIQKYECHFERHCDGMIVELRWRLTQSHFQADLGMDWLWPRKQTRTLLGTEIPTISPEHTLILLCLHGSKHGWSRLIWIRDVAQLIIARPDLDWALVLRDARRFGLSRALALGVLLSVHVMGVRVPERVHWHLRRSSKMRGFTRHIAENLFDDAKRIPVERVPYHIQLLGIGERWRWRWSLRPFRPNQRDRDMVALPSRLEFLYYMIRPVRLMRDHWQRNKTMENLRFILSKLTFRKLRSNLRLF